MKQKEAIRSLWTPTAGMLTGARRVAMLLLTTLLLTLTAQTGSGDGSLTHSILESALRRGLGVRQLARLTGVSYGIIQRINEKWVREPLIRPALPSARP